VIALIVASVVVLAAVGVALYLVLGRDANPVAAGVGATTGTAPDQSSSAGNTKPSAEGPTTATQEPATGGALPDPTGTPDGLGDDAVLDVLAQACYAGDMQSCDDLFDQSDAGSDYETYGDTCAGRQPPGTFIYCTDTFPQG